MDKDIISTIVGNALNFVKTSKVAVVAIAGAVTISIVEDEIRFIVGLIYAVSEIPIDFFFVVIEFGDW